MAKSDVEYKVDLAAIGAAIRNPRWEFRTPEGIAEDLGLSSEVVARQLAEHPEIARKSAMTDRHGRELYAAPERRPTLRERLEQIRWILAH
jgi:spore maturation protein CgeB